MTMPEAQRTPYPAYISGTQQPATLGMLLLIMTEGIFFALLFTSYFYIRSGTNAWPQGNIEPEDLVVASINTFLLVASSLPLFFAEAAIKKGDQWGLRIGLGVSFTLGVAFLLLQLYEYQHIKFRADENAYASLFFVITGFHTVHVFVGLIMNLFVQIRAWLGHFSEKRHLAVQNASWYWHFVDAVWIFIFLIVYLSPHWYQFGQK
ncbi:MAG TPA: heme-copper oxidase subunit III [Dehalococcoidia bacterium]|jgi:heme/copper-type cytochrome/quinol oxidase subunit 3